MCQPLPGWHLFGVQTGRRIILSSDDSYLNSLLITGRNQEVSSWHTRASWWSTESQHTLVHQWYIHHLRLSKLWCTTHQRGFRNRERVTDPFIISGIEDLEHHFATQESIRLDADITLLGQWIPIENWYGPFNGNLLNGHTVNTRPVSSLGYEGYGLFGVIREFGEVRNLKSTLAIVRRCLWRSVFMISV